MSELFNLGMTSNNTPTPYIISESSVLNSYCQAFQLFLPEYSDPNTWHSAQANAQWVKINLGTNKKCLQYAKITNRVNDPANIWAPVTIKISGSNDDSVYTQLFYNGSTVKTNGGVNLCNFSSNTTEYKYYKFDFTGTGTYSYIALHHIDIYEKIDYNLFLTDTKYVSIRESLYNTTTKTYNTTPKANTIESVETQFFKLPKLFIETTINGDIFTPFNKAKELISYEDYIVLLEKKNTIETTAR